jgi:hypothetical protein
MDFVFGESCFAGIVAKEKMERRELDERAGKMCACPATSVRYGRSESPV